MTRFYRWLINMPSIQSHIQDLGSLNAIWSWLIMLLFCWGFIHIVRHGTEQAVSTAFTVFGGVASVIITGHITSKTIETVKGKAKGTEEPGASD
jgi:hypothetical protein